MPKPRPVQLTPEQQARAIDGLNEQARTRPAAPVLTGAPKPMSTQTPEREAAKARVRAKLEGRQQMTAREYIANLLHATNTHADAEAILDRFERETPTAARLSAVLDICDREQRNATRWENPIPVPEWVAEVQRAALGDDVRTEEPFPPRGGHDEMCAYVSGMTTRCTCSEGGAS